MEMKTQRRQLMQQEDYTCTANCRTKTTATFREIFEIFAGIFKFLFTFPAISRGPPNNIPRSPGWETLVQKRPVQTSMWFEHRHMKLNKRNKE